ncbi:hypothetical protein AX17_006771 [Amanita inopinata Kibby_2008]|nr:hypothetical protein AX17_006771 [Amanita inopinata Kibby_2008]
MATQTTQAQAQAQTLKSQVHANGGAHANPNAGAHSGGGGGGKRGGNKGGRRGGRAQQQVQAAEGGKNREKGKGKGKTGGKAGDADVEVQVRGERAEAGEEELGAGLGLGVGVEEAVGGEETVGEDECFICAEPFKYYSVSACNHRTCHVCALRLRALYKKMDCTFCKEPQNSVVFTASPDRLYGEYDLEGMHHRDAKLSIHFETQDMMEETLILLRFNCPDPDCDYIGNGWGDLRLHTRAVHNRLMCDLCMRNKKVFAHEHALYHPNVLPVHLPSMHQRYRSNANVSKDQVEGGVHPLCEFCQECFFGDDELYSHCRERHEECFICKRNEIRYQYFQNYDSLERHFNVVHYPCTQPHCLARKFVVFGSVLDLKAHMVEEHGGDMTSRSRKDARRVVADFTFEEAGRHGHGHGHGRRDHNHEREREREPPPTPSRPPPAAGPAATAVLGPSRLGGAAKRREAFGARLTVDGVPVTDSTPATNLSTDLRRTPTPPRDDAESASLERSAALTLRLQSLAANPTTAVPAVKAAIRGYRASESSARDLISTIWSVMDGNLEHAASIVNAFVDLLDEEEKKQDLLASWKGFTIEQRRQFPELVPTAVGANYAAIATGRVLNAKHSTVTRSSRKSSRQVWDRVAQAAGSTSSSFPPFSSTPSPAQFPALERFPLPQASTGAVPSPAIRPHIPGQRNTPWASSSSPSSGPVSGGTAPRQPNVETKIQVVPASSRPASGSGSGTTSKSQRPPKFSVAQFPELPTLGGTRQKAPVSGNVSLRNILGVSAVPAVVAWQGGPAGSVNAVSSAAAEGGVGESEAGAGTGAGGGAAGDGDGADAGFGQGGVVGGTNVGGTGVGARGAGTGKGKKGKGKQKQTLFTLGSFPT